MLECFRPQSHDPDKPVVIVQHGASRNGAEYCEAWIPAAERHGLLIVAISMVALINAITMGVLERTREIGVLRAIGMTRAQLTRMIRIESEITALIGAVVGIVVGIALAWVTTLALASWDLSFGIPWGTILALALAAFLAGLAAGVVPARRAAHLNPLRALHYE